MVDSDGEAKLDEMVAETGMLIDQANEAVSNLRQVLKDVGCDDSDTMRQLFQSGECPPELRKQATEELEKVHEELAEEENHLRLETNQSSETGRPRSGMTKI